jgi:hypothetical protein
MEYCGYAHQYMTSLIQVLPSASSGNTAFPSTGASLSAAGGGA